MDRSQEPGVAAAPGAVRAERRAGAIGWIALGLLAGCLAPVPPWALDAAIDLGFAASLLILGVLVLLRSERPPGWHRPAWFAAALLAGLAHAASARSFAGADDPRVRAPVEPWLVSVDGWLEADPVVRSAQRTTFSLEALHDPPRTWDIEADALPCALRAGDLVRVHGWLRPDPPARNPGGLHLAAWRAGRGTWGAIRVEDPALVQPLDRAGIDASSLRQRARAALARGLRASLPSSTSVPVAEMLVAMNIGVAGGSMSEIRLLFARTGLSHFIVISGFHLAVVASVLLLVLRIVGASRRLRGAVVLLASIAFVLVLESQVSVWRAGLSGIVVGASLLVGRSWSATSVLALVTIVVLAEDPSAAESPAFQLSFGAVAALLVLAPVLTIRMSQGVQALLGRGAKYPQGLRRVAIARIAVRAAAPAVAAWIAVTPITLHHFGQAAPWAIPASVLLGPMASAIAVLGTATALLSLLSPALASLPGALLAWLGSLFLHCVESCAALPGATALLPSPPAWWAALTMSLPFAAVMAGRRSRHRRFVPVIAAAWLISFSVPLWPSWPRSAEVLALDRGRARAALLRAGSDLVLVDAGSVATGRDDGGASGARAIARALVAEGVVRIDLLVLTEHSLESLGAAADLLESTPVGRVLAVESITMGAPATVPGEFLERSRRLGVPIEPLRDGAVIELGSNGHGLRCRVDIDHAHRPPRRARLIVDDPAAPPLLQRAIDEGVEALRAARGARRWRRPAAGDWVSDRFAAPTGTRLEPAWAPCPPDEGAAPAR